MAKNLLTRQSYEKLLAELVDLEEVQLPAVLQQIKEAREAGDLSENSEYHAAKEKQAILTARISQLKKMLEDVEIVDEDEENITKVIKYGSYVTIEMEDGRRYDLQIVGSGEVDVEVNPMKISFSSPIGGALEGKKRGDVVRVKLPAGRQNVRIVDVK